MESHQKGFLKSKCFLHLKILTPLYLKRLLELFFLFLFFLCSFSRGVLMIFEDKITASKTSFQMASIY
jgi:hypothetical protein